MNNVVKHIVKGVGLLQRNQLVIFRFSKLQHFFENYKESEFDLPPRKRNINELHSVLLDAQGGDSKRFNITFSNYVNYQDDPVVSVDEMSQILGSVYSHNIHLSKQNKDWFIKKFQQNFTELNSQTLEQLQQSLTVGIVNEQIIKNFEKFFYKCDITLLSLADKLNIVFIYGFAARKFIVFDFDNQIFIKQWALLTASILQDLKNDDLSYITKYAQIAYVIKIEIEMPNIEVANGINCIFEKLTQKVKNEKQFNLLLSKDIGMILSCCLKIRHTILKEDLDIIINNIIGYIATADLNQYNDLSLCIIVQALTTIAQNQKLIGERIVEIIKKRMSARTGSSKYCLIILCEIYFRWDTPLNNNHLKELFEMIEVIDLTDLELSMYFQLFAQLPKDFSTITIHKAEHGLQQRQQRRREIWSTRKDPVSVEKIKRSLQRLASPSYFGGKQQEIFQRIALLFE